LCFESAKDPYVSRPLHLLIVADSDEAAAPLLHQLKRGGFKPTTTRVEAAEVLEGALNNDWDLLLVDDAASQLAAAEVLAILKDKELDLPIIIVGDGASTVALMRAGARDYITKNDLTRLTPVVERELHDAQLRRDTRDQHARLQTELKRRFDQLRALHQIDSFIAGNLDLSATLGTILDHVILQLQVDAADILLLDPNAQLLQYSAGRGFRSLALQYTRLRLGEGYAGRAVLERRTLFIQNLSKEDAFLVKAPLLKNEGFVAYLGVPLIARGNIKGVLELFHRTSLEPDEEWMAFLEIVAGQAAIAIDNADLFNGLQRSNHELSRAYDATLEGWSQTLDMRDRETEGHTRRVTETTLRLAEDLGVEQSQLAHIRRGALLHDIGKMGVPDSILLKPGRLTPEEWAVMRKHPVYAYNLLSLIEFLRPAIDIPYCHHEKWNGKGYPRGLKADEIPIAARIFAVADVWDALCSDRPYRRAWPETQARQYIRSLSGIHFDPRVVELFFESHVH
jgi:response regulator RpfG family c-di-GMP phosphodiesterase